MTPPVVSGAQGDGGQMDDETLAELQRLSDEATPGPWEYNPNPSRVVTSGADRTSVTACYNTGAEQDDANARFITAARNALPSLLRELGDTRARLARAAAIEREARTVAGYLAVHGPRVVYYRLATALGATDQAGDGG